MKKKLASVLLCAVMAASMLTGCGNADNATATTPATDNKTDAAATTEAAEKTAEKTAEAAGSVYYLNFKPEVDEVWQKLAKEYTEETGVPVKVVTAASGTYEQTLMSEIANKGSTYPVPDQRTYRLSELERLLRRLKGYRPVQLVNG